MRVLHQFSHLDAISILKEKKLYNEIIESLHLEYIKMEKGLARPINEKLSVIFSNNGWGDNIKVKQSRLTINFVKYNIGLNVQFGNAARVYADIMKLMAMYEAGSIEVGVLIVACSKEAKAMGDNLASYERCVNEVEYIFNKIIHVPLLVIGLSND